MLKKLIKSTMILFGNRKPDTTLAQSFEALANKDPTARSLRVRKPPPVNAKDINELKFSPISKLNVQEIELLARERFRGSDHVEQDKKQAVELWAHGCKLGSVSCCYNYATAMRQGIGCEKNESQSFKILLELADEHRHAVAHYDVAVMASLGMGMKTDEAFIFKHFHEAANGGVVQAMFNTASMYSRGAGVEKNDNMALKYYEMAAYHGDANAMYNIGAWFFAGRAVEKNTSKSLEYYLRAAHKGHHGAAFNVAVQYMQGDGVDKDLQVAAEWYEKAGNGGMPQAWYNLAKLHLDGLLGDTDLETVKVYLTKGATLGDRNCIDELKVVEERIRARGMDISK